MPAISISVKPQVYIELEEAAARMGLSKSRIAEDALSRYLSELEEDASDAAAAEAAIARFEASGEETVPASEVYKKLGI